MRTFFYMFRLAALDIRRLVGSLVHTSIILAGTGLAIVLLWGLTAGLVRMQEEALEKSPTATVVSAWLTSPRGSPLTRSTEARWLADHSEIVAVVPDIKKVVTIRNEAKGKTWENLTLQCTVPGDPLLAFHQADVLRKGEHGLVLSRHAADKLGVQYVSSGRTLTVPPGEALTVQVSRSEDGNRQGMATVSMVVRGVVDFGDAGFGYADRQILDWVEDFQQGRGVPELGWKACAKKAPATYSGYLCFVRSALDASDVTRLAARGLSAQRLDPVIDPERCTLGKSLLCDGLHVYFVAAGTAQLSLSAQEVEEITDADDVVVPWVEPINVHLDGRETRLVGISLQKRWLQKYFMRPEIGFQVNRNDAALQRFALVGQSLSERATVSISSGSTIPFAATNIVTISPSSLLMGVHPSGPLLALGSLSLLALEPPLSNPPLAVVPSELLANVHALKRREVTFDSDLRMFLPVSQENVYYQGRFYARSLHTVPIVDGLLREAGFTTQSERTRIEEIQNYARILRLLVAFVGGIVLVSGVCTLAAVLSDNTTRKRGALGILRLMGVSRLGILTFVVGRALLIGGVAGLALVPLSLLCAGALTHLGALCVLEGSHLAMVVGLAIGSSLVGVLYPAFLAGRIDPMTDIANKH